VNLATYSSGYTVLQKSEDKNTLDHTLAVQCKPQKPTMHYYATKTIDENSILKQYLKR